MISEQAFNHIRSVIEKNELSMYKGTPDGQNGGYWVQKLEESFRQYFNTKHAIAMNSATSCLHVACLAIEYEYPWQGYVWSDPQIGVCGRPVYVTPFSFSSSASCVVMTGGYPVFRDIDEDTFTLKPDPEQMTSKVRVAIPVHLFGHPAELWDDRITMIEDCAQSIGAMIDGKKVGTFGKCGIFSFNNSKTISSGEGGMFITNDDELAERCRALRNHAEVSNPDLKMVGYNFRLGELEAIIAYDQFTHVDDINAQRIELCEYVTSQLKDIEGLTPPVVKAQCTHVYWMYALKIDKAKLGLTRDEFNARLKQQGILFTPGYNPPLNRLPIYKGWNHWETPVAEGRMYNEELMVTGMFKPPMTMSECKIIVEKIRSCANAKSNS